MGRMRIVVLAGLAAALAVGVQVAVGSSSGGSTQAPPGAMAELNLLRGVNFVSACRFSHRAMDDPIVYPGQPGASHDHTFVGNTSTDAFSTLASLRSAGTTCQRRGDTAAYWVPTLLDPQGEPVEPLGATIYYRRKTMEPVVPFPSGLRMIAGDAKATDPQPRQVTFWNCGVAAELPPSSEIPTCPGGPGRTLRLHISFPSCWDGMRLDSPDHQRHMAYPVRGRCPSGHPVEVPAISLIFRYPVAGGEGYRLASGGDLTAHGDFFNAWQQGALTGLVNGCLNALRDCGRGR